MADATEDYKQLILESENLIDTVFGVIEPLIKSVIILWGARIKPILIDKFRKLLVGLHG